MKKHSKRFMLIFKTISGEINTNPYINTPYFEKTSTSEEEFDNITEVNEIISEYTSLYKDEIPPVFHKGSYVNKYNGEIKSKLNETSYPISKRDDPTDWEYKKEFWDFSDSKKWWAYIVLDFNEERIIKYGGDSQIVFCDNRKTGDWWHDRDIKKINLKTDLRKRDLYFCGDDEIPKNYHWDIGEYEGWLQYRWGDGKNALTYVEPPKPKKKKEEVTEEASEEDLAKYLSNYEPLQPNNDNEIKFNDETFDYIEETQNIEKDLIKEDERKFKNNFWRY